MRIRTDKKSLNKGARRLKFYASNFLQYYMPDWFYRQCFQLRMRKLTEKERKEAEKRAGYYCNLPEDSSIEETESIRVGDFKYPFGQKKKFATYFFDLHKYIRLFPKHKLFIRIFGDVNYEADSPAIVKTRPIKNRATNSVIMKLNSVRHFVFVDDAKSFREKENRIVFRNEVRKQPWRYLLLEKYIYHPMCDFGRINHDVDDGHPEYTKPYMPMDQQMDFKFVCCIEGNDVATNLKWVMSSNSIAVMPRPKMESWFMEGTLKPDYHYIEIAEDYSDLIEKTTYYANHPDEAEEIIRHAHEYVKRFCNKKVEDYTSFLVLKKYFDSAKPINDKQ